MKKQSIHVKRAELLYTVLANGDRTKKQILAEETLLNTGWDIPRFRKALQKLRDILGEGDTITVVSEPAIPGKKSPWIYGLRAGHGLMNAEKSRYLEIRFHHIERLFLTLRYALDTAVRGSDGRSRLGKKARVLQLHLKQAADHLELIDAEFEGGDTP